jgi:hypothetical protein
MKKGMRRKRKRIRPDDWFDFAGTTIARYGRFIHMQSHRTPEQQQLEAHWVAMYPQVVSEINDRVSRIRQLVSRYDPLELLKRGYWAMSASMIGKMSEHEYSFEDGVMARMVDYVQAVIVSTPPATTITELTDDLWQQLHDEVGEVYRAVFLTFHIVNSAMLKATQAGYDPDYDSFCVKAQMHATVVRALRYPAHDWEFLEDFLGPHDDEFFKLFGISVSQFIRGLREIHHSLTRNGIAAFEDLHEEHQRAMQQLDAAGDADLPALMGALSRDPEWQQRMQSITGRISGLDLFELERFTTLPKPLLEELSLEVGQDDTFFASGDYAGWPLRVFPTKWRPFLKVDGKHYCFDPINIMDDIYRTMQRLICRLDTSYVNTWKDRQQEASERRPIELLQELLPGATVYRSVCYPWRQDEKSKLQWCELDGLVIYDDLLIAVEVKGGAFTWTPPITDFPAYLKSVETLLKKPADQARRFLKYLHALPEVPIYNEKHEEIATLFSNRIRVAIPLCITLDALTTAANKVSELAAVGIKVSEPICCMAIDDLRVYRDILLPGVVFAHFLQKRQEAERDPLVHVNDELDHLGLYLAYLDYVRYARVITEDLGGEVRGWDGYRKDLDKYYMLSQYAPDEARRPNAAIGTRLAEIIACINAAGCLGRCGCVSALLDMPKESRDDFDGAFEAALTRGSERGQPSPFHIQGESSVTVFCYAPGMQVLSDQDRRDYVLAWMTRAKVARRLVLVVRCNAQKHVASADWEELLLEDVPPQDRPRIAGLADSQARRRVSIHLRDNGRIGRNEPCPCGSGRKYKRCCGSR